MADPITTTVLVPNFHCSSCVSVIEAVLSSLDPPPLSASTSIVTHSITIRHSPSLSVSSIRNALEVAGFDIYGIFQYDSRHSLPDSVLRETDGRFAQAVTGWNLTRKPLDEVEAAKLKIHLENCEACSAHLAKEEKIKSNNELVAVVTGRPSRPVRVLVSIQGMTCGSCSGIISKTLEKKPWVRSVNVSLLTASASVTIESKSHLEELVESVEDLGYEATVESIEEIDLDEKPGWRPKEDVWKAAYSIGGMTCSSCVGNIKRALEAQDWIKSADVNLITNSATVVFNGKSHLPEIEGLIEDVGYEAKLDRTMDISTPSYQNTERTVGIRIDGLHCNQCPIRIQDALGVFGDGITIEKLPQITDPILRVIYVPRPPQISLREFLARISEVDPKFEVSIYREPSLEERSRRMHTRYQRFLALRLVLSTLVAIPSLIIGIVYMSLVPSDNATRMYLMQPMWAGSVSRAEWALFILATPVYFFAADVFHHRTIKELRALWRPGSKTPILRRFYRFGSMDMLMSFGTSIAYLASIAEIAIAASQSPRDDAMQKRFTYFDSVVFLTFFLLLGRLLEAYSKSKTGNAVATLGKLRPSEAILVESGRERGQDSDRTINVELLEVGDVVKILQGGSPPYDGIIIQGQTKFDESSLTGESRLISKSIGDEVFSGTVNKESPVLVRISSGVGKSMLDKIVQAVRDGQTNRAPIERVADIITSYFVPIVTLIAIITWVTWLTLGLSGALPQDYLDIEVGGWPVWSLQFAIAAFVVACPCGIGLAAPTALFVGGGLAAQHGILAKGGGEAFQEASHLDCVVFDKTGTLTKGGTPAVTDHEFLVEGADRNKVLGMINSLEQNSSHPLAKAIVAFCASACASEEKAEKTHEPLRTDELAGKGMKGSFKLEESNESSQVVEMVIGNETLLADHGVTLPEPVVQTLDAWKAEAKSVILVATKGLIAQGCSPSPQQQQPDQGAATWQLSAIFAVSDPIRGEAPAVVQALQRRGVEVWMISGDNPRTAHAVGHKIGIPPAHVIAGVLPDEKAKKIQWLQRSLTKAPSTSTTMHLSFLSLLHRRRRRHQATRATIAMVGDGINDSPALTAADVGIAIGSGSDVAISSAKFVLLTSDLRAILTLVDLSRAVFRRVKLNFAWALAYNLVALPVAAGLLYPIRVGGAGAGVERMVDGTMPAAGGGAMSGANASGGGGGASGGGKHVRLDPVWASLAMALSSLTVVGSSLLLRTRLPVVGFRARRRGGTTG